MKPSRFGAAQRDVNRSASLMNSFVSGHDFSRAEKTQHWVWALAPAPADVIRFLFTTSALGAALLLLTSIAVAQRQAESASTQGDPLRQFLQHYLEDPHDLDKTTRYISAFVMLSGEPTKQDAIVYVYGRSWCGTGGCVTLILAPTNSSYEVIGRITVSRPPISVLNSTTNGWHDLSVVQGGGIQLLYDAKLSFDGKAYPNKTSVLPAQELNGEATGRVVISQDAEGRPLYP